MTVVLQPVQNDTVRGSLFSGIGAALDHGSDTAEPVHMTDVAFDDPNVIFRFNNSDVDVSTETLTSVPDLAWSPGAGEQWEFEYILHWTRGGTTTLELALVIPTDVQVYGIIQCAYRDETTPQGWFGYPFAGTASTISQVIPIITSGTLLAMPARIYGVACATAAGSIDLQLSKGDANSSAVSIEDKSFMIARKIKG